MHVVAVFVSEAEPLQNDDGALDIDRIRRFVSHRLHLTPRYRQRIGYTPVTNHPIWVDDPHFSVDFHVRHTALPRPGTREQLRALIGRIAAQPLDRNRPLWELWFVEGLERGEHFATLSKVHHCMVDGASGAELMTVLMSTSPEEKEPGERPDYFPHPAPATWELVRDEALRLATGPLDAVWRAGETLRGTDLAGELSSALANVGNLLGREAPCTSETPLDRPVGPDRCTDLLDMDLDAVKAVKNKLGGTINDIVLAVVAGAVRRYLLHRRLDVSDLDFRVCAPLCVGTSADAGARDNRVAPWIVSLPVDEPEAVTRLEHIRENTRALKSSQGALGADRLTAETEWTGTTLLSRGARVQHLGGPANLVVTNVPGPQVTLYTLGGRMLEAHPIVPLLERHGLAIALFSYADRLCWGLNADPDLVPDLDVFRDALSAAFEELRDASGPARAR